MPIYEYIYKIRSPIHIKCIIGCAYSLIIEKLLIISFQRIKCRIKVINIEKYRRKKYNIRLFKPHKNSKFSPLGQKKALSIKTRYRERKIKEIKSKKYIKRKIYQIKTNSVS